MLITFNDNLEEFYVLYYEQILAGELRDVPLAAWVLRGPSRREVVVVAGAFEESHHIPNFCKELLRDPVVSCNHLVYRSKGE